MPGQHTGIDDYFTSFTKVHPSCVYAVHFLRDENSAECTTLSFFYLLFYDFNGTLIAFYVSKTVNKCRVNFATLDAITCTCNIKAKHCIYH